ncbi:MAG TPA: F0F1 ATP synthase subunit A [Candidatus Saccharimonadia bacterium]|nr:F0F1 ATP synthase subunit A [Candidatus Saccharimonadia bacterium]
MITWLAETAGPHVSLVAEPILQLGPLEIRNSMLLGLVGTAIMLWLFLYTVRRVQRGRHTRLSIGVYWLFELMLGTIQEVMGSREQARRIAPLALTIFFLVIINNWLELLPIVGPVTWHGTPLFRGLASDLSFTLGLAIITMVTAQIWAIRTHGFFGNLGRYFANPFRDPMHAFEGLLELVAEFSRLIALAMRLFGNIFGGEVLLVVMAFITSWAAPLTLPPFMLLELFVGAVQAYVFFMLTIVFVSLGSAAHHAEEPAGLPQVGLAAE